MFFDISRELAEIIFNKRLAEYTESTDSGGVNENVSNDIGLGAEFKLSERELHYGYEMESYKQRRVRDAFGKITNKTGRNTENSRDVSDGRTLWKSEVVNRTQSVRERDDSKRSGEMGLGNSLQDIGFENEKTGSISNGRRFFEALNAGNEKGCRK